MTPSTFSARALRFPGLALCALLAGCSNLLETSPPSSLPADQAITSAAGARAALSGAYDALQSLSYYGGDYIFFNDLYADNAIHVGTSNSFADADARSLFADNPIVESNWDAIYDGINRCNNLIQKVPPLTDLDQTEKDQILGEAYFLRALHYHNLVKIWGDTPMRLVPAVDLPDAASITRSPVADVYTQILADLAQAETLITSDEPTSHATIGAVKALQARVYLYKADYVNAGAKADEVIAMGYDLATDFADLFDADGVDTPEDIFKVKFDLVDYTNLGYYYINSDEGGAGEVAPEDDLIAAFDTSDARYKWSISLATSPPEGLKFPTTYGAEDFHVIRFAEVLLIKAESQARQNQLGPAVDTYNLLRVRAGLAPHVLNTDVTTQAEVLAAIDHERREELAFEGDRFPDLVRTGAATTVLGIPVTKTLFPIPQGEIDVAPNLTQNPGY